MTEARDKFKAAAHAIIDAMPDGMRVSVSIASDEMGVEIHTNEADHITFSANGNTWPKNLADIMVDIVAKR